MDVFRGGPEFPNTVHGHAVILRVGTTATFSRFWRTTGSRGVQAVRGLFSCDSFGCPSFGCLPASHGMDNRIGTTECTTLSETLGRNTRHSREQRISMVEDIDADSVQLCHSSPRAVFDGVNCATSLLSDIRKTILRLKQLI